MKIKNKGITLVALIITIVVMLILITAVVSIVVNEEGIITHAKKTMFYHEMTELEEEKTIKLGGSLSNAYKKYGLYNNKFLGNNLTTEELKNLSNTLKAEIVHNRTNPGSKVDTKQMWNNNIYNCQELFLNDLKVNELSNEIYYIKKNDRATKKYIYDSKTDICYKISDTKIKKYIVHSMKYAKLMLDNIGTDGTGVIIEEFGIATSSDGTIFYEPDLNNFSYDTEIIYYSNNFEEYSVKVEEYIDKGKNRSITVGDTVYTFANYIDNKNKTGTDIEVWANIRCKANNIESNWVWIPRYAYKLETTTTDIIFIDIDDKPLDTEKYGETLPDGYIVHEAFRQKDGLKGIWFSKYEPSYVQTDIIDKTEPNSPDLSNFNTQDTKLIYYNINNSDDYIELPYTNNPPQVYNENYYFYNYKNNMWANIKCTSNNIESWWVWIPRFAYVLGEGTLQVGTEIGTTKIIFVDENDKPIDKATWGDTLPEGYKVHDAFNQDGKLKGIWFSKYEPIKVEN